MSFISPITIMTAMQTLIKGLKLPPPKGDESAFATEGAVMFYAHENVGGALKDLLIFDDRVCLIVPTGHDHQPERTGQIITHRRRSDFVLLISDRVYGDISGEAAFGSVDTPGAVALGELVATALAGQTLGLHNVGLELGRGEPFALSDKDRKAKGVREVWSQVISTQAGEMRAEIGRRQF